MGHKIAEHNSCLVKMMLTSQKTISDSHMNDSCIIFQLEIFWRNEWYQKENKIQN